MEELNDYPLSTILAGMKTAWGIVLYPLAAIGLGLCIPLFLNGDFLEPEHLALILPGIFVFLALSCIDVVGLIIVAPMLAAVICFWFCDRGKIESLFALCILTQIRLYAFECGGELFHIGGSVLITVLPYVLIRAGPRLYRKWRQQRPIVSQSPPDENEPDL